jgi:hypothetical protein
MLLNEIPHLQSPDNLTLKHYSFTNGILKDHYSPNEGRLTNARNPLLKEFLSHKNARPSHSNHILSTFLVLKHKQMILITAHFKAFFYNLVCFICQKKIITLIIDSMP